MKVGVSLKLDVTKIDKARLFQGEKGTYLNCTAFIDLSELDQYGNSGMVTQDVSKDERDGGVKGAILGNSKVFYTEGFDKPTEQGQVQQVANSIPSAPQPTQDFTNDDIPF